MKIRCWRYFPASAPKNCTPERMDAAIRKAFSQWNDKAVGVVRIIPGPNSMAAHCDIRWEATDEGKRLARFDPKTDTIWLNSNVAWRWGWIARIFGGSIVPAIVHEIGHFLGVPHNPDIRSIMFSEFNPRGIITLEDVSAVKL